MRHPDYDRAADKACCLNPSRCDCHGPIRFADEEPGPECSECGVPVGVEGDVCAECACCNGALTVGEERDEEASRGR